jgi:Protein of unknown function DUF58
LQQCSVHLPHTLQHLKQFKSLQAYLNIRSPFRLNFFIALACFFAFATIFYQLRKEANNILPLLVLLLNIIFAVVVIIGIITILLLAFSYLYFKKYSTGLQLSYTQQDSTDNVSVSKLHVVANHLLSVPLLRPAMVLAFNNNQTTEAISLEPNKKFSLSHKNLSSEISLELPSAKTYQVQNIYVLFRDAFGFFNLPCKVRANNTITYLPAQQSFSIQVNPKYSKEPEIHITEKKKIDGEFLRFKPFESTDDTRRILWKVYARTKELMVRTPEIWNPYASELHCYASFYTTLVSAVQDKHMQYTLSKYKQSVYSIVQGITQDKSSVKFKSDQQHQATGDVRMQIADSEWQQHLSLNNFASSPQPCIAIISGLANADDVQEWLQRAKKHSLIFYVPMQHLFKQNIVGSLLHRIFFVQPQGLEKQLRMSWWRHPLKRVLRKNEEQIEALLKDSNLQFFKV